MKVFVFLVAAFPLLSSANEIQLPGDMQGLPEDFKEYFYNSEIGVQVYLNDVYLFDANVSLKENGDIKLLKVLDEAQNSERSTIELWSDILRKGVSIGKCTASCPSGLMQVEYQLNNSAVKLYTSQYETSQVANDYLTVPENTPNGLIMYNDVSVSEAPSMRSWGINSSITSSFGGWNQQASFQSSGTSGEYNYNNASLYELYTQKELQGNFVRLGLFTPENDAGNVQTSGFGYDTVTGVMWGTSDALLANTDSVSAFPVYITGRNQSVAEVWRDGRLLRTQQLQPGVQALDTRQLPVGIYDITIKIIENGRTVDTQQAQIFKNQGWNNPNRRWRMNLWGGQNRTFATYDIHQGNPFTVGGGAEYLLHPQVILGLSGAASEQEQHVRTRANITLSQKDRLFAQYTVGNSAYQANKETDIRYYRTLFAGGSANLYWRSTMTDVYGRWVNSASAGKTWGASLSTRLPLSSSLIFNTQYIDTTWRQGAAADVTLSTQANLYGRDTSLRVSAYDRPGFDDERRDRGIAFNLSMSLAPAAQHTLSFDTGMEQGNSYSGMNYQWQPQNSQYIRYLGGGLSWNDGDTILSGNGAVDTPWASGDFYAQQGMRSKTHTLGANLSQMLIIGGGKATSFNGNNSRSMESAVIVDVEADDENTEIQATSDISENKLHAGRNIIPVDLWKKNTLQFSARGGDSVQVFPERQSVQMNRGSVHYMKVKTVKTFTLVGMLQDEQGRAVKNRYVQSDVAGGMVNAEGVLTLDSGVTNRTLKVRAEQGQPALQCELPAGLDTDKKVQFISAAQCRVTK